MGILVRLLSVANYNIIQTLQPGASPSANDISGPFNVSASFAGFAGPCQVVQSGKSSNATRFNGRAGISVWVSGIGPLDGEAGPTTATSFNAARRTCLVSWRCAKCRLLAANNVSVNFHLVPSFLTIEGVTIPASQAEFSVFRGTLPVTVPVALYPLHFEV
eukprot:tig00000654_g2809.t1